MTFLHRWEPTVENIVALVLHAYGTSEGVTKGNLKRGKNPNGAEERAQQLRHLMQFDPNQDIGGTFTIFGADHEGNYTVGVYREKTAAEWEYSKMRNTGAKKLGMGKMPAGMKLHKLLSYMQDTYKAKSVNFVGDLKKGS